MHFQIWLLLFAAVVSAILISSNIFAFAQTNTIGTKTPVKAHGVKITSPSKGQKVQINNDKGFTVTGISIDNTTSDCQVSIILNNVKPYQKAKGTGPGGLNDYSNWIFTPNNKNPQITTGNNELTAKLSCSDPSATHTKYYSVNVTGVESSFKGSQKETTQSNSPANNTEPFIFPIPSNNNPVFVP